MHAQVIRRVATSRADRDFQVSQTWSREQKSCSNAKPKRLRGVVLVKRSVQGTASGTGGSCHRATPGDDSSSVPGQAAPLSRGSGVCHRSAGMLFAVGLLWAWSHAAGFGGRPTSSAAQPLGAIAPCLAVSVILSP